MEMMVRPGNVPEEKECELEEFIDYAKVIMGTWT